MISRFRRYAREHGLAAALGKAAGELRSKVFSEMQITVLLKDLDAVNEPRRTSGLEVVPLTEAHLGGLSELNRSRGRSSVDRRFRANLERGLQGFVGLRDGVTVGYYWWVRGEDAGLHPDLAWLGESLQIEPGDVYGSDFYILPEYREGGTANEFLYRLESAIAADGYHRIWGYVESGNRQARWLYSSRGYQPMGDLSTRKLLFFARKAAPRHE
ncbi:MAG TPA: GNAT family N-acetyltransferase [Solirubrobacterales bacterium]|nr:GNAT family N-acetyltransferase [Solirubrobacterales bacterium]